MSLTRRELLRRTTALVVASRFRWLERAFAAAPNPVRQTLEALVGFVVPDRKLRAAATPRLIRTLDRFLPGPLPLSSTAASILNATAAQVNPGSTFDKLSDAERAKVFDPVPDRQPP